MVHNGTQTTALKGLKIRCTFGIFGQFCVTGGDEGPPAQPADDDDDHGMVSMT